MPIFEGANIRLREWRTEDFSELAYWLNDKETTKYLGSAYWPAFSLQEAENYLRSHMESTYNAYHFVIAARDTDSYIGQIDLISLDWRMRNAEMAIVIARKENRCRGYGSEAVGLLKSFAFDTLGLERLELEVLDVNKPALSAYRKAGFQVEGTRRHAYFCEGSYHDKILMGCLKNE